MTPSTAWKALTTQPPQRFLLTAWPWRSLAYLASGAVLGAATLGGLILLAVAGVVLSIVLVGLLFLVAGALSGLLVAPVERVRLRLVDLDPTSDPHKPGPSPDFLTWFLATRRERGTWRTLLATALFRGPHLDWLFLRLREQATWRELAYTLLLAGPLWVLDALAVGYALVVPAVLVAGIISGDSEQLAFSTIAALLVPTVPYAVTGWAGVRAKLTRTVLDTRGEIELDDALVEVTRSRARIVDAFEAERRRIERDLHDGVQQRLVALTVDLGLARMDLEPGSAAANRLAEAQEHAKQALAEMRELIRGVHPQVLTDRGLPAAVADLAGRSPVPVEVDVELPGRLPPAVEAAAYFAVAEALTNVAKHSGAAAASVRGRLDGGRLVIEIRDDGAGGADPSAGTGITGLADRIAVVDGRLRLSSPASGPTVLRVEIPCEQIVHSGS